jgi:cold shock CspA family protein
VASTGTVVRFDRRRGYGFIQPDDGAEDVFVHQNNINMEGFRYLQVGEKVTYELEVGEKGMKAVGVSLTEPRVPRPSRDGDDGQDDMHGGDDRDLGPPRMREPRPYRQERQSGRSGGGHHDDANGGMVDKLRRKQERLISLLVEKGVLQPGEIDGLDQAKAAVSAAPMV